MNRACLNEIIVPLLATGSSYFLLDQKVTKNQVSAKSFFAAHGLCPANKAEPKTGKSLPGLSWPLITPQGNDFQCLCRRTNPACSVLFSPEAWSADGDY
jgi:hypothetical protein